MMKILGIYRHPMFSNNAIEADRLILEESLAQLQRISPFPLRIEMIEEAQLSYPNQSGQPNQLNHQAQLSQPDQPSQLKGNYALVLTMAQSKDSLTAIEMALPHTPVWNSTAAIRNCYRKSMSQILSNLAVGYVPYHLLPTNNFTLPDLDPQGSYWLKRSDFHAIADEDVTLAESAAEVALKLERFHSRGVSEVILQRHVHGDIYKFYGVKDRFFRALRVRSVLNGAPNPNLAQLEKMAAQSASALGLLIYGGDAILDAEGKFHLIDLNDWPSFRICRPEAAEAIAELCLAHLSTLEVPAVATSASYL